MSCARNGGGMTQNYRVTAAVGQAKLGGGSIKNGAFTDTFALYFWGGLLRSASKT